MTVGEHSRVDQEVEARLTALLYRNAQLGTLVNVVVSAAIALLGVLGRPGRVMIACWLLLLALALLRMHQARQYARHEPASAEAPQWRARHLRGTALMGGLWLLGGSAVMWHNDDQSRLLAALAMTGLVAGAVPVLGAVREAFRIYAIPMCVGLAALSVLDASDLAHWIFVLFVLVFLVAVLRSANYLHRTLVDALTLDIEKGRMLGNLEQARAGAEAANVAKTQFLATMSHELRTPLTGVLGMADLLCQPDVSAGERQEYAQIILSSGKALLSLLNDILDLSKVEAGRMEIRLAGFHPAPLLDELTTLFGEPVRLKGVSIRALWQGPADAHYVSDPIRIRQMLTNLIANAVKFTDQGSIQVEGRELGRSRDQVSLEFAVSDTGLGIAPEKLDSLFKPFSRLDNAHTRRSGGTGLGLSIVRRIALLMGGDAGVASEPGQGSRFWVRIQARSD